MDELEKAYETIGVPPEISTPDLQRFYRELVKRWHPDQFGHDAEQRQVADETLRDINAAYQRIMKARNAAEETAEPTAPKAEPEKPEAPVSESSGGKTFVMGLALLLVICAAGIAWQQKWLQQKTARSESEVVMKDEAPKKADAPTPPVPPPAPPGPVIAQRICIATESFVVDIWHNGKLVPDKQRKMVADRFGACTEEVSLTLREGDWLVFNPVKNRFRWNDSLFFGVAGMMTNKTVGFVSSAKDGRWTSMENVEQVSQFIKERDHLGQPVQLIEKGRMWSEGPGFMNFVMSTDWKGEPIWGQSRNTYIKFVAKPVSAQTVSVR